MLEDLEELRVVIGRSGGPDLAAVIRIRPRDGEMRWGGERGEVFGVCVCSVGGSPYVSKTREGLIRVLVIRG